MESMYLHERDCGQLAYAIDFEDEAQRDDYDLQCTKCGALFVCEDEEAANERKSYARFCECCGCQFL